MRAHIPPIDKNNATSCNLPSSVEVSSNQQVSSIDIEQLLLTLNSEQLKAVEHDPSIPLQILAGPGSGKTKVLTSRIVQLIHSHKLSPSSICAVTFTNKAANEMRDRLTKIIGKNQTDSLQMGTFHSLCAKFLRIYARKVKLQSNFTICDADESKKLIAGLLKPYKEYFAHHDITLREGFVASAISKAKAKGHSATTYTKEVELLTQVHSKSKSSSDAVAQEKKSVEQIMADVYTGYERILKQNNALDFDDLLVYGVELFSQYDECVSWCKHILVDEFQDTNAMQYELMKSIATRQCITIVGDPDQSIYGWRSAEVVNLSKMRSDFPTTRQIFLEQNYRSTASILKTSLAIVQEDRQRIQKSLYTSHPPGSIPVIREFESEKYEAAFIAFEIKRCVANMGGALRWGDFVVLLRFNALSRPIESALQKEGIPCRILGGHKFFERMEVKDLLSYLQMADNPNFNPSFIRAIKTPSRGVGDKTLAEIATCAEALKISQLQLIESIHDNSVVDVKPPIKRKIASFVEIVRTLRKLDAKNTLPSEMIRKLVDMLNYEDYLRKTQPDWESRWENVQELITFASEVESEVPTVLQEAEEESGPEFNEKASVLRQFLQASMLSSEGDNQSQEESKEKVTLSTCHAAKGLEWPVVIIPSVDQDTFPFYRTEDIEEERRLLYVACTRAQSLLYLSHSLQRQVAGKTTRKKLSNFISAVQSKNQEHFSHDIPRFLPQDRAVICKVLGRGLPDQAEISKSLAQLGSNGTRLPPTFLRTNGGFSAISTTGVNSSVENKASIDSAHDTLFDAGPSTSKSFEASFVSASSVAQKMQPMEGLPSSLNTSETGYSAEVEVAARRNTSDRQASKQDSRQLTLDQKWLSPTHHKTGTIIVDVGADISRTARSNYKPSLMSAVSTNTKSASFSPTPLKSSFLTGVVDRSDSDNHPSRTRSYASTGRNGGHTIHATPSFHGSSIAVGKAQTFGLSIGSNDTRPLNSENHTPMPLRSSGGPMTGVLSGINKTSVNYDMGYIEGAAKASKRLPPLNISQQTQQSDVIMGLEDADAPLREVIGVSNAFYAGRLPAAQTTVKRRLGMGRTNIGYSNKKFKRPV